MNLRARHPLIYVAPLVSGAVVALALFAFTQVASAQQQSATFTAEDNFWDWTGGNGTIAEIATGGIAYFSDEAGGNPHNVAFTGSQQPACIRIPGSPNNMGWSGECRFNSPGMYAFVCEAHPQMTGRVDVVGVPGQPPPPGGSPPGSTPPGGSPPGEGGDTPGGLPTQPASPRISFARRQTGSTLRGSVTTSGGAKIVVTALVSNRALSIRRPKQVKKVKVGSQTKRPVGAGKTRFAVRLNAAARRALNRRERLAVVLRIVVSPAGGQATTKTVSVALRAD